jgi:23S rRNA (adenine1618-N6)-methyltransferase
LLGTVVRPNWRFFATEMDEKSHSYAIKNVEANDLTSRIKVIRINPLEGILPLDRQGIPKADFTMCNPPFYASETEMLATFDKDTPPSAVCTGADCEMITEGGDAGFVVSMVNESKLLGSRVQWYTSMLGKLSSVSVVTKQLKHLGCMNWAVGCLLTGGKTRRWVVGWSWGDIRPASVSFPHTRISRFICAFI